MYRVLYTLSFISCLGIFLSSLYIINSLSKSSLSFSTEMPLSNDPHRLEVLALGLIYRLIEPNFVFQGRRFSKFREISERDSHLYFVPVRLRFCQANFMSVMLNGFSSFSLARTLYYDAPKSDGVKAEISRRFSLINRSIYAYSALSRLRAKRNQREEWAPAMKVFWGRTRRFFGFRLGKSLGCVFQAVGYVPGHSLLTQPDAMADAVLSLARQWPKCEAFAEFFPTLFRLYDPEECRAFFAYSRSEVSRKGGGIAGATIFARGAKGGNWRALPCDSYALQGLSRRYKGGASCQAGGAGPKVLVSLGGKGGPRLYDTRGFRLRAFAFVLSTRPLVVLFHKGITVLDSFRKTLKFRKCVVKNEDFFAMLRDKKRGIRLMQAKLQSKMKRIAAGLVLLIRKSLLSDPRLFQLFALDFRVGEGHRVALEKVNPIPRITKHSGSMLLTSLRLIMQILDARAKKLYRIVEAALGQVMKAFRYSRGESVEEYIQEFEKVVDREELVAEFGHAFTNDINLSELDLGEFDVLYDGTKESGDPFNGILGRECDPLQAIY